MPIHVIDTDMNYDLQLVMYPSFLLPLVSISDNTLTKMWGVCRGLRARKSGAKIIVEHGDSQCIEYAYEILGLWFTPSADSVSDDYRDFAEILVENYSWFGIATSPLDDVELFASIFLSQNTDFHVNVVKWMSRILEIYGSIDAVLSVSVDRLVKDVGKSYQVRNLLQALNKYMELRNTLIACNSEEARPALLSIKGVGPKVLHSYLLFVKKDLNCAAVDKNLLSFLKRFEVLSNIVADMPRKDMCTKYSCQFCSFNKRCTYYRFHRAFGRLSGWIQTIAYMHNKLLCRNRLCERCFLKHMCKDFRDRR